MRPNPTRTVCAAVVSLLFAAPACAQLLRPHTEFGSENAPPAPDYAKASSWAALPESQDQADLLPPGAKDRQKEGAADIFFVHPTTYLVGGNWNGDVGDATLDARTDSTSMRNQASIFNAAGPVYAPRYRQGILYAYLDHDEESLAARDLAYSDVLRAFEHYLEKRRNGRPFVLAGHSQGSHHVLRLLEERIAGTPLAGSLVAAYLVGVPMPADKLERTLPGLPLCHSPSHTGCIVSWNTVTAGIDRTRFRETWHHYPDGWEKNGDKPLVCVNPLSWSVDDEYAETKGTRRAVRPSLEGELRRTQGPEKARCREGLLEVLPDPGFAFHSRGMRSGDYHRSDYPLFHFDLRENVLRRVEAFARRQADPSS